MNDKINLGVGFTVVVIETIPDDNGNNLEGFLHYLNEPVDGIDPQPLFKTIKDLENHFRTVVLSAYIEANNGDVYSIKYFQEENSIYEFVRDYFSNNKVNWGQYLDVISILSEAGYHMPKHNDKGFTYNELEFYKKTVKSISLEFKKHLVVFGFGADRDSRNMNDYEDFKKEIEEAYVDGTMNIVFTRFPWTSAYKINATIRSFISISGKNFFAKQKIETFKKFDEKAYSLMSGVTNGLKHIHIDTKKVVIEVGYDQAWLDFTEYMDAKKERLIKIFRKKRPHGTGTYK